MKPQKQPTQWACLATSFAIVLDVDVQDLFREIGHDGSEVMHRALPEPERRRAHHVQELIDCCDRRRLAVTHYEACPVAGTEEGEHIYLPWDTGAARERFKVKITGIPGVFTGLNPFGRPHAWAWTGVNAIDPALGRAVETDQYSVRSFYAIRAVQSSKIPIATSEFSR